MKKFISAFSVVVIALFLLSVFGWMSVHISKGDKDFGFANEPIKFMYSFFDQFKETVKEVKKMSPTFLKTVDHHKSVNRLDFDVKILTTFSSSDDKRVVAIKNLKNDSIEQEWILDDVVRAHDRVLNPIVYPNNDLIYSIHEFTGLRRVNASGDILWKQDSVLSHHSTNLDADGNIWYCGAKPPLWVANGKYKLNGRTVYFRDDFITQVDANTGRILFNKSVAAIFKENKMENYLLHSQSGQDPMHINDIQPAMKNTKFYDKGDVFISLKQISLIFQYRPSTNKVIRAIKGPFAAQHDVDFLNDSTLTWFNNNYYALWTNDSKPEPKQADKIGLTADLYSNIVKYDLSTGEFSFIGEELFRKNWIFSGNEGLHEFINDSTYFVEQQNSGYLWVIQNDEVLYKDVFDSHHSGYHHLPNWNRILK